MAKGSCKKHSHSAKRKVRAAKARHKVAKIEHYRDVDDIHEKVQEKVFSKFLDRRERRDQEDSTIARIRDHYSKGS